MIAHAKVMALMYSAIKLGGAHENQLTEFSLNDIEEV